MELLLTGKPIDVERAKEIGLVWRVVEAEELQAEAMAWARTLTRAAPGAAGHQGGGVADRRHGLDRVGALR